MSAAKRFSLVLIVTGALAILGAAAAHAQASPSNPSGGTGLRQTIEEGPGAFITVGSLSHDLSFHPAWQSWLGTFTASRFASAVASRPTDARSMLAIARRLNGRR